MRIPRELRLGEPGQANCFHVVSRVVDRNLVFGDEEKEFFRSLLERQLRFSGLRCLAWCFMGNHFHLLLEVPDKEAALEKWSDEDFVGRLGMLGSERYTRSVLKDLEMWQENGNKEGVEKVIEGVRARLFDLSAFMKEFKYKFSVWFNKRHGRKGTLWEERFRSVLVEGTGGTDGADRLGGLLAVAAYIDLNPVRAGICDDPKDYRWCSYAAAVAGDRSARVGISQCAGEGKSASWRRVARAYRLVVFGAGEERMGGETADGAQRRKRGVTQKQIDAVFEKGGRLPLPVLLRCRVRYFTEGTALGSREFLRAFLKRGRGDRVPEPRDVPGLGLASSIRSAKGAVMLPG